MSCFPCLRSRRKKDVNEVDNNTAVNTRDMNTSQEDSSGGSHQMVDVLVSPNHGVQAERARGALKLTMAELNRVTGNFSESHKIGQGGFGTVYQGKLRDGTAIAIKRAKKDAFETRVLKEFQTEVDMLSQVEHLNLVRLMGFLEEKNERILVTEFVTNGNLRQHLDEPMEWKAIGGRVYVVGAGMPYGVVLDMGTRLNIAIDVAQALTYLHYYTDRPIIHRDVKSSNILITDTFRAKVADFGFSRAGPSGDAGATHVSTQVKGTAGYLDPEYLTTYQLNVKSDVYSFGILLVELFTGRRPIELRRPSDERVTVRWAFKKFVEGKLKMILDPRLVITDSVMWIVERLFELAFSCSAPTKGDRPSMKEAQELLSYIRKDYQAVANYRQGDLEAGNLNLKNSRESIATSSGVWGFPGSGVSQYGGESEGIKAPSSRQSDQSTRNLLSRETYKMGFHDSYPSQRNQEKESLRSTRTIDDNVQSPQKDFVEGFIVSDIPSVPPLKVPNQRRFDRRQLTS